MFAIDQNLHHVNKSKGENGLSVLSFYSVKHTSVMMMRNIFLLLIFIPSLLCAQTHRVSFVEAENSKKLKVAIKEESFLVINGKTNVNKFHCFYYNQWGTMGVLVELQPKSDSLLLKNARVVLHTDCFDCKNQMMNKDFQQLLQSEAYPSIEIEIKSINRERNNIELSSYTTKHNPTVWVKANFVILGIENQYYFPVKIIGSSENEISLKGSVDINLLDYNIAPPNKLLGLIEVQELITIDFFAKLRVFQP